MRQSTVLPLPIVSVTFGANLKLALDVSSNVTVLFAPSVRPPIVRLDVLVITAPLARALMSHAQLDASAWASVSDSLPLVREMVQLAGSFQAPPVEGPLQVQVATLFAANAGMVAAAAATADTIAVRSSVDAGAESFRDCFI